MSEDNKKVVIIGGGIVGISTAFYLNKANANLNITIIDSTGPYAGASGKAGGFIASDWTGPDINGLSELSWQIHQDLANEFDGYNKWGYRRVTALSLLAEVGHRKCPQYEHKKFGTNYLDPNLIVSDCSLLGSPNMVAQVTPKYLCQTLLEKSQARVIIGEAIGLRRSDELNGRPTAVVCKNDDNTFDLECDDVVLAAGPWTGELGSNILHKDEANVVRIGGERIHSLILKPPKQLDMSNHCLFVDLRIRGSFPTEPEVFPRPDGTAFVCGSSDDEPLPKAAHEVKIDKAAIDNLRREVSLLSPQHFSTFEGSLTETIAHQACYMPIPTGSSSNPLIGTVSPGIHVGAGHSVWGILLGPGTGKILSEIILDGKVTSADIKSLTPDAIRNPIL